MAAKNDKSTDQDDMRASATDKLLNAKFDALEKANQVKRGPGRPKKDDSSEKAKQLWHDAMMTTMASFQVKAPTQLDACSKIADEYVRLFNEKFKD